MREEIKLFGAKESNLKKKQNTSVCWVWPNRVKLEEENLERRVGERESRLADREKGSQP